MEILSIKNQLKKVNFKNYFIYQVEPEFKELHYGFSVIRSNYIEFLDTNKKECPNILKLNYSDINKIYMEDVLLDIYMTDKNVYHFKEIRLDLQKILNDFKGKELTICNNRQINVIQNYKIILENDVLSIIGNKIDEKNNINPFKFNINYNNLTDINEEYSYNGFKRVDIKTKDNDDILIYCE